MRNAESRWFAIASGIVFVSFLVGCGGSKISQTDGPVVVLSDGPAISGGLSVAAGGSMSTGAAAAAGGVPASGGTTSRDGAGGSADAGTDRIDAAKSGGLGAGGIRTSGGIMGFGGTTQAGTGGIGGGVMGSGGASPGGGASRTGGIAASGGLSDIGGSGLGGSALGGSVDAAARETNDATSGTYRDTANYYAGKDVAPNPLMRLCPFDTTKPFHCSPALDRSPCAVPNELRVCFCEANLWQCGKGPCPTDNTGGFPGNASFNCDYIQSARYECLYPDATLCECNSPTSKPTCLPLGQWEAGMRDAAVPDAPLPDAPVGSKPACLSDLVSSTCDPATQRYCTMPSGLELCECRGGSWACSASGCPTAPSSQTTCPGGSDMMCNSTGSNVCICQASGYFLCGSI